jgi:hypothetical protein
MSITRSTATTLNQFAIWCASHLVPKYFKYWELYSYSGTVFGARYYRVCPYILTDEEPINWETNYNDYYTLVDSTYVKNEFESDPGWEADTYYRLDTTIQPALYLGKTADTNQHYRVGVNKGTTFVTLSSSSTAPPDSYLMFECDGGILMRIAKASTYVFDVIIAKTNNGETAVIYCLTTGTSTPNVENYKTNVNCVAWGDDPDSNKQLSWLAQEQNQTQLATFTTFAKYGDISYTPTAFYCPKSSVYALRNHTVVYDDVYYVTNGYWMIKDEAPPVA